MLLQRKQINFADTNHDEHEGTPNDIVFEHLGVC